MKKRLLGVLCAAIVAACSKTSETSSNSIDAMTCVESYIHDNRPELTFLLELDHTISEDGSIVLVEFSQPDGTFGGGATVSVDPSECLVEDIFLTQ